MTPEQAVLSGRFVQPLPWDPVSVFLGKLSRSARNRRTQRWLQTRKPRAGPLRKTPEWAGARASKWRAKHAPRKPRCRRTTTARQHFTQTTLPRPHPRIPTCGSFLHMRHGWQGRILTLSMPTSVDSNYAHRRLKASLVWHKPTLGWEEALKHRKFWGE